VLFPLYSFVSVVRAGYFNNPYHNWQHAFDVAQTVFAFMVRVNDLDTDCDCSIHFIFTLHAVRRVTKLPLTLFIQASMSAGSYLRDADILALLIAALCHDLEHPGYNNRSD